MLYHYWRTWTCALGCDECFESATAAGIHEGVKSRDATADCPLCKESNLTIKEYVRHVGRHQKDLSLFSLPPLGDDDDNIDLDLNQGSEQASEDMEDEGDEILDDKDDNKGNVPGNKKVSSICPSALKHGAMC